MRLLRAEPVNKPKPTWQVHARPVGATHEPWQTVKIEARSELQAEAMLKRRGYEMSLQTAMRVPGPGSEVPPRVPLRPLLCERCGYALKGLMIDEASVVCPECSYPQALVAWSPEVAGMRTRPSSLIWVFAVLGMIFVALFFSFVLLSALQ